MYAEVIACLSRTGYFQDAFGSACVDDADNPGVQDERGSRGRILGIHDLDLVRLTLLSSLG